MHVYSLNRIKDQGKEEDARTNLELGIFNAKETMASLSEILRAWAAANIDIEYIQGMNELVGIILMSISDETLENPYSDCTDEELIASYFFHYQ